jgi:hypothetical protein
MTPKSFNILQEKTLRQFFMSLWTEASHVRRM